MNAHDTTNSLHRICFDKLHSEQHTFAYFEKSHYFLKVTFDCEVCQIKPEFQRGLGSSSCAQMRCLGRAGDLSLIHAKEIQIQPRTEALGVKVCPSFSYFFQVA